MRDTEIVEAIIRSLFFLAYTLGTGYGFFLAWFRFSELRSKLIKRNRQYVATKWSFEYWSNRWIVHWSYKWFIRSISLILFLAGGAGLLISLYLLSVLLTVTFQ
jgi:hypothetical protein